MDIKKKIKNKLDEAKGDWRKAAKEAMKHPDYQKNNMATYLNIQHLGNGTYGNPYNKERFVWDENKKQFTQLAKIPEIVVKVSGYNDSQLSYNGTCEACGEQSYPQKLTYYTPDERMTKIKSLIKHKDNCPLK